MQAKNEKTRRAGRFRLVHKKGSTRNRNLLRPTGLPTGKRRSNVSHTALAVSCQARRRRLQLALCRQVVPMLLRAAIPDSASLTLAEQVRLLGWNKKRVYHEDRLFYGTRNRNLLRLTSFPQGRTEQYFEPDSASHTLAE